jgi:serine protease AprX
LCGLATTRDSSVVFSMALVVVMLWALGATASALPGQEGGSSLLRLRCATYDPLTGGPPADGWLWRSVGRRLHVVQGHDGAAGELRARLDEHGLVVVCYWPDDAFVVRCAGHDVPSRQEADWVRWSGPLLCVHKLAPELAGRVIDGANDELRCNVVLSQDEDRGQVCAIVVALGGRVLSRNAGSLFVVAALSGDALLELVECDGVLFVEEANDIGFDMDHARVQGGANHVEALAGHTGRGIRVETTEGLDASHTDWTLPPLQRYPLLEQHGQCVAGILAGNGAGDPLSRGMLPDAQLVESSVTLWYGQQSRFAMMQHSVDAQLPWRVMLQTASWGHQLTLNYDTYSADLDAALFAHDLLYTQSMGNSGGPAARPEAWSKNAVSVGGIRHNDNSDPADDLWGGASHGPAADGRFKPDVVGYFDSVRCADVMGVQGYSTADHYLAFGGTSAATPMVAGHLGILQQMFTDGMFGNPLQRPANDQNRFANRPHAMTAKALLLNTARAYAFQSASDNLARSRQGWGFPDLAETYDMRQRIYVGDEYDVLQQGQSRSYVIWVRPGTPELRVTMAYADPAASPAVAVHRVNDLDLRVDRLSVFPPQTWNGNHGLDRSNQSMMGGQRDDRNTVEQVWLQSPQPGFYRVSVTATAVVMDGRPETPQLDVDFALVMQPMGGGYRADGNMRFDLASAGPGQLVATVTGVPTSGWVDGFTFLSFDTWSPAGFGDFFGLRPDGLTTGIFFWPAAIGDVFHFRPGGATDYPLAPHTFPSGLVSAFSGIRLDGFVALFDANGEVVEMSNVDRVAIR